MKFEITHKFDVPREVFEDLWDRKDVADRVRESLPNLKSREILEESDEGGFIKRKIKNDGAGNIPERAKKFIKPGMLTWIEESVYDKNAHSYEFRCTPTYFKKYLDNYGTCALKEDCGKTVREIKGVLNIKIPIAGKIAESIIIRHLKDNSEAEYRVMNKIIDEYKKKAVKRRMMNR